MEGNTLRAKGSIKIINLSTLLCFEGAYEAGSLLARLLSIVKASFATFLNTFITTLGLRSRLHCSVVLMLRIILNVGTLSDEDVFVVVLLLLAHTSQVHGDIIEVVIGLVSICILHILLLE